MSVEIDWELAYLTWFNDSTDPRKDVEKDAKTSIECVLCETALEWRGVKEAACPECGRRVPAGEADAKHVYAKNYSITVRK